MNTGHKVIRYIALALAISIIFGIISVGYNVVNIFVSASMDYRLQRAIKNYGVDEKKAGSIIMKNDKRRGNYYSYHVGEKWTNLNNYDLVVRSDVAGIDRAVACICAYLGG